MTIVSRSPSPCTRTLAAALRKALDDNGVSARHLAKQLGIDHSHLSRVITGERVPSTEFTSLVMGALRVDSVERERIMGLAREASRPNWLTVGQPGMPQQLAGAIECERAASKIVEWSLTIVPGLMQTDDYVRAVAMAGGLSTVEAESRVMVWSSRREILTCPRRATYDVLIDESALRRPLASPKVMTEQLRSLIALGNTPNITLRVVPYRGAWHPGLAGPFVLYDFPDAAPVLHFEHYSSGAFVADSIDVDAYRKAIDTISGYALDPDESTKLIAQIMVDEWSA